MKTVILHSEGEDTGVVHSVGDALVVGVEWRGGRCYMTARAEQAGLGLIGIV